MAVTPLLYGAAMFVGPASETAPTYFRVDRYQCVTGLLLRMPSNDEATHLGQTRPMLCLKYWPFTKCWDDGGLRVRL